jgi:hypothetical protein
VMEDGTPDTTEFALPVAGAGSPPEHGE